MNMNNEYMNNSEHMEQELRKRLKESGIFELRLSEEEKQSGLELLLAHAVIRSRRTFPNFFQVAFRFAPAFAAFLILVIAGGSLAAEGALPGDLLYPVKVKANENVRALVNFSDQQKAQWELEVLNRRLTEAHKLAEQQRFNEQAFKEIETQFISHTEKLETITSRIEEISDSDEGTRIRSDFAKSLKTHEADLDKIKEAVPETVPQVEKLIETVQKQIEKTVKKGEKEAKEEEKEAKRDGKDEEVVPSPSESNIPEALPSSLFREDFLWKGEHAAIIKNGQASTVWWDRDAWDTRTDTTYNAIASKGEGNHIDIHQGNSDPSNGNRQNSSLVLGGDGSQGVGVMHLDFEGIIDARLRNPIRIDGERPAVVEFRAPKFVTSGHWWEIALTPAYSVIGGDFTAVPSTASKFTGLGGPGRNPAEDSLNILLIGRNDVPCKTGWEVHVGARKAVNGETKNIEGLVLPADPSEKETLYRWRILYYKDRVVVAADFNQDGILEHINTFAVSVPWDMAYVHLLGAAYQASKHPQNGDCKAYQGQVREIPWKEVRIGPMAYERTAALPKRELREEGWMSFDLRDTQRIGVAGAVQPIAEGLLESLRGVLDSVTKKNFQPNLQEYDRHFSMAFCSGKVYGCTESISAKNLAFDLLLQDASGVSRAQLVYDTRGEGTAQFSVNGVSQGQLPGASGVRGKDKEHWIRRSADISPGALQIGTNTLKISMEGDMQFDRLEIEMGYDSSSSVSISEQKEQPLINTEGTEQYSASILEAIKSATVLLPTAPVQEEVEETKKDSEKQTALPAQEKAEKAGEIEEKIEEIKKDSEKQKEKELKQENVKKEFQIKASVNDAYHTLNGYPNYSDTDQVVYAGAKGGSGPQVGGWRWTDLGIPQNAVILKAYAEFNQSGHGHLMRTALAFENSGNPQMFSLSDSPFNRWQRKTDFSISWEWQKGKPQDWIRTPDLSQGIQELINAKGALDSIVLLENGEGVKQGNYHSWMSFDGDPAFASKLSIEYTTK